MPKLRHFMVFAETAIGDICGYMVCPKKDVCDAMPMFISAVGDAVEIKETSPKRVRLTHLEGEDIETVRSFLRSNPNTKHAMTAESEHMIVCWWSQSSKPVHEEWGHA